MPRSRTPVLAFLPPILFAGLQAGAQAPECMQARTFTVPGIGTLPYRFVAPPRLEKGRRYPLLLCLHGAGERGNDNARQTVWFQPLFDGKTREAHPAFGVIPQVPEGQRWASFGWSHERQSMAEKATDALALTRALLAELIAQEPVDPARIYVTGLSMGGFGTWEAIQRWPDLFAAAVPVCGGGDPAFAQRLAGFPIWAFHGAEDPVVKPEATLRMIAALEAAGGRPGCTLYPGVGHDAWRRAYTDPLLLEWLFAQRKPE